MRHTRISIAVSLALSAGMAFAEPQHGAQETAPTISAPQAAVIAAPSAAPGKAVPATAAAATTNVWPVHQGSRLRAVIEAWAATAGWAVHWKPADLDFVLGGSHVYYGPFDEAAIELFESIRFAELKPRERVRVELVTVNQPPMVMVVRDEGTK